MLLPCSSTSLKLYWDAEKADHDTTLDAGKRIYYLKDKNALDAAKEKLEESSRQLR